SKDIKIGAPNVEGVKVVGTVLKEIKDKKVVSFKYKRRKGYRRKIGHRQKYTEIEIKDIVIGKEAPKTAEKKTAEKKIEEPKTVVKKPVEKPVVKKPAAKAAAPKKTTKPALKKDTKPKK
ncbi:50S ribosomal protein L21, partial [bacterium]|nr:50S ribosomal protein L21 [bacterium]